MTTNHPAHGPVSLDRLHQISEILSKAAAQIDGGNLGYAMADAVKVIDVAIAAFGAEPVAWRYRYVHTPKTEEHGSPFTTEWKLCDSEDECNPSDCFERQPLYTVPPAPRFIPVELTREEYRRRFMMEDNFDDTYRGGWNACRAAMLQAGTLINEGTIPATRFQQVADLYGITSPTGSETSFTFNAFEASSFAKGGWSVQEYVELERYQQAVTGNSPVSPDGWKVEAERLAEIHGCSFVVFRHGAEPQCADPAKVIISFTDEGLGHHSAAPQQEVNNG